MSLRFQGSRKCRGRIRLAEKRASGRISTSRQNDHQHEITAAEERRHQIQRQYDDRVAELEEVQARLKEETALYDQCQSQIEMFEKQVDEKEAGLEQITERIATLDEQQQQCSRETTEAKVVLAKSEERLENLKSRLRQFPGKPCRARPRFT